MWGVFVYGVCTYIHHIYVIFMEAREDVAALLYCSPSSSLETGILTESGAACQLQSPHDPSVSIYHSVGIIGIYKATLWVFFL